MSWVLASTFVCVFERLEKKSILGAYLSAETLLTHIISKIQDFSNRKMTDFQSIEYIHTMLFVNVVQSNKIGLPYLFQLKQPSKYATPSIFFNFLTSKSSDCSIHVMSCPK